MIERLEEFLRKEPFVPFRIILSSGTHYDVSAPLMVNVGRSETDFRLVDALSSTLSAVFPSVWRSTGRARCWSPTM